MIDVSPESEGNRFRAHRIDLLKQLVTATLQGKDTCSILDVGGTRRFWDVWHRHIDWSRTEITCVNLRSDPASGNGAGAPVHMLSGDACDLSWIEPRSYDIVFSNSVIEHVGPWRNMKAMAGEVRRIAPRYLVQTPNFWFPVEPHARTPFLHWLPDPLAYRIVMVRNCGYWPRQQSVSDAVAMVQSAKLIDIAQMKALFEDAEIIRERYLGMTKALIAIKRT
jgi:hypothetical protein